MITCRDRRGDRVLFFAVATGPVGRLLRVKTGVASGPATGRWLQDL